MSASLPCAQEARLALQRSSSEVQSRATFIAPFVAAYVPFGALAGSGFAFGTRFY